MTTDKVINGSRGVRSSRNQTIDIIKLIAAFFVILLHFPLPGMTGQCAVRLSNFAVPFFFMCSGYFCYGSYNKSRIIRKTLHIVGVAALGILLYGIYGIVTSGFSALIAQFTVKNILKWALFNVPFIGFYHMWFLYALIYAYLVWLLIGKYNWVNKALPVAISLICFRVLIYEIVPLFTDKEILPISLGRSAWLVGIPFFLVGHSIGARHDAVERIKIWTLIIVSLLGAVISLTSGFSVGVWFTAVCLFILAVKKPAHNAARISQLSKKHCMVLYILHPLVGDIFIRYNILCTGIGRWFMPGAIILICLLISAFTTGIVRKSIFLRESGKQKSMQR